MRGVSRKLRKIGRAAHEVGTWDPLDLLDDPHDRRHRWSSDEPDRPRDLEGYARQRGLNWSRDGKLLTFHCIHEWAEDVNLNTTRGMLAGTSYGVLGHQLRDVKVRTSGPGPDGQITAGTAAHIREGHTFVATLVPETKRTLVAATAYAAQLGVDRHGIVLEPLENDRTWRRDLHARGDRAVFDAIWNGPVAERMRAAHSWGEPGRLARRPTAGGKLDVRAGIVSLWVPGYLEDPAALDDLVDLTFAFAAEVRALCAARVTIAPFAEPLPAPAGWTGSGKAHEQLVQSLDKAKTKKVRKGLAPRDDLLDPGDREDERWAGLRDFAAGYAGKRGLQLEDGDAFERAFPTLPYTGWAQFAARGTMRDSTPYRIALSAQRPFIWEPAYAAAGAVAVAPVAPGRPDQPLWADAATGCTHAVTDGLYTVAAYAPVPEVGHRQLDLVTQELQKALAA